MKLSIVIPCYNEIKTIALVIDKILSLHLAIPYKIVIVDDCSKDNTRDYLKSLESRNGIKVLFYEKNRGKETALSAGFF